MDWKNEKHLYNEYIVKNREMKELADDLGVSKSGLYYYLKKFNLINRTEKSKIVRSINEDKISLDDPIFCYYAGLVSADGFVSRDRGIVTLTMCGDDSYNMVYKISQYFEYNGEIKERKNTGGFSNNVHYEFTITSAKLLDTLEELNIVGLKSDLGVRFPNMDNLNDECQSMYIRGLLDGDGSLDVSRGRLQLSNPSMLTVTGLIEFLNDKLRLDMKLYDRVISNGTLIYYMLANRVNSKTILDWIYSLNIDCCIKYKHSKYIDTFYKDKEIV